MNKVNEYLNISPNDLMKMTRKELSDVVSTLASAGNKRLRRLEQSELGKESFAYQNVQKSVRKGDRANFSVKGKNLNQLRNEYKNVANFLNQKTSSVTGWKKELKNIKERIGKKDISANELTSFFSMYRKLEELNPTVIQSYGSTETQRLLSKTMRENPYSSDDEILKIMEENLTDIYESEQRYMLDDDDYDEFDDLYDE